MTRVHTTIAVVHGMNKISLKKDGYSWRAFGTHEIASPSRGGWWLLRCLSGHPVQKNFKSMKSQTSTLQKGWREVEAGSDQWPSGLPLVIRLTVSTNTNCASTLTKTWWTWSSKRTCSSNWPGAIMWPGSKIWRRSWPRGIMPGKKIKGSWPRVLWRICPMGPLNSSTVAYLGSETQCHPRHVSASTKISKVQTQFDIQWWRDYPRCCTISWNTRCAGKKPWCY